MHSLPSCLWHDFSKGCNQAISKAAVISLFKGGMVPLPNSFTWLLEGFRSLLAAGLKHQLITIHASLQRHSQHGNCLPSGGKKMSESATERSTKDRSRSLYYLFTKVIFYQCCHIQMVRSESLGLVYTQEEGIIQ